MDSDGRLDRRTFGRLVGGALATAATGGTAAANHPHGHEGHHGAGDGRRAGDGQRGEDGRRGGDGSDGDRRVRRATETLVSIPGELTPENLAVGPGGDLYFGITAGQVRRVPRETALTATGLSLDDTDLLAEPPAAAGVEATPSGTLYVAVNTDEENGVWVVPADGGGAERYVATPPGFVNDIRYDPTGTRLFVTESFSGRVLEVPVEPGGAPAEDAEPTAWLESPLLDTDSFGANGLTFRGPDELVVAVTRTTDADGDDVGRLVRVPIRDDGRAGAPSTLLESAAIFGADGITARGPTVYVAANARNRVLRVPPGRPPEVVADAADGLVFPSDVVFGGERGGGGTLFVCNFAVSDPDAAAILRSGS